jgi:hypothetical protein
MRYLNLSEEKSKQAIELALAEVYFDFKMNRMDTSVTQLHNEAYNRALRRAIEIKKAEVKSARERKKYEADLEMFMTGLS